MRHLDARRVLGLLMVGAMVLLGACAPVLTSNTTTPPAPSTPVLDTPAPVIEAASPLFALKRHDELADHAGAACAALLATVLFIPVLGLVQTAGLLFGLQALALGASWRA